MARSGSTFYSAAALIIMLCTSTSCQEHKRLEAETAVAREQVQELRAKIQKNVDETADKNRARNDLISARPVEERGTFSPTGVKTLEDELAALQAEKSRLDKDVKAIDEEHQQYKKSSS